MRSLLVGAVLIACTCASQSAQASPLAAHLSPACEASAPGTLLVSWHGDAEFRLYYVSIALDDGTAAIALETTTATALNFTGLARSTNFQVAVRGLPKASPTLAWGPAWATSSAVRCSTSNEVLAKPPSTSAVAPGDNIDGALTESSVSTSSFLRVFRVSEYSFDVDFLKNHDAASITAMPLYFMTCDPVGNCSPFDVYKQNAKWDECHAAMQKACPDLRGATFTCMKCVDEHRASIEEACGAYADGDTTQGAGSFAVHWWCGVGWPESAPMQGPVTEYCVEYSPVTSISSGFSGYLSCNSDEVDSFGNDPRDPSCICICYDDRLLAHQTIDQLKQDCYVGEMPWVNETVCNCTGQHPKSPLPQGSNPSLTHVGRAPVWLPYVGHKVVPAHSYKQKLGGYNYHFPAKGMCAEGEALGTNGCTWRRLPRARMINGRHLLQHGWDTSFVPDTNTNFTHTLANVAAFQRAISALDAFVAGNDACGH